MIDMAFIPVQSFPSFEFKNFTREVRVTACYFKDTVGDEQYQHSSLAESERKQGFLKIKGSTLSTEVYSLCLCLLFQLWEQGVLTPQCSTKQSKIINCINLFLPFQVETTCRRYLRVIYFLTRGRGKNVMSPYSNQPVSIELVAFCLYCFGQ